VLEQALTAYAGDPDLLAARTRLQEERLRYGRAQGRKMADQARIALARREYRQAVELLSGLPPEVAALPEVSGEVARLLEEARRGQQELEQREVLIEQPPSVPAEAAPASYWAKRLPTTIGVLLGVLLVILVAYGISRRMRSHVGSDLGQLQLNAVPWAEVLSVRKADGKDLHITGQTPMELELPPGRYVITLKNGKGASKVDVVVDRGKLSAVNYSFPDVNVDAMVDELVSKY